MYITGKGGIDMKIRMNKKLLITVMIILSLSLLSGIAYFQFIGKDKPVVLLYKDFMVQVKEGKVETVYYVDEPKIEGKLANGKEFITDNPRTEGFKETLLMHNVEVEENSANSIITNIIGLVGFIAVFAGMAIFMSKQSSRQTSMEFNKMSNIEAAPQEEIKVTFASVAGNEEAKESIMDLVDFLRNPEKYAKYGARIPRGVILYGPPGTGKTLLAKALAGEAGVPFYAVSGSDFVQIYAGLGAGRIRSLFKKAREHQKCVIFIDEIDALGKKRDGMNGNDENDRTLNALLTEMSGFNENEGIIIIAATNRLDTLDEALLRPGRFDRQIEVGLPDVNARHKILQLHSNRKPLAPGIDLGRLAHETVYFSGAELESLLNEAAILAAKQDAEQIKHEHIDKAYYTVIAGEEKKDRSMISQDDRRLIAYHEAGHALITKLVAPENRVTKVTIIPSTKGAGGFSMNIAPDKMCRSKKEMLNQIKISLGGRAAEEIILGEDNITTGASNDIEKATATIVAMMKRFGMNQSTGLLNYDVMNNYSNAGVDRVMLDECKKTMDQLYEETKMILQKNVHLLDEIADTLLEKETVNEDILDQIINGSLVDVI
ncbi:MAG: hflB [Anaerosolibacter sp.]|nr:hflB [Anaerosolibacter sp.]